MLDFPAIPEPDPVIAKMAATDVARVLGIAARCAGATLFGQRESIASTLRDYPTTLPALMRSANAALHPEIADGLVDLTESFISVLAAKSPAAAVLKDARSLSLARWSGGALRVDSHVFWPGEVNVSVTVARESKSDAISLALCETGARELDYALFSTTRDAVRPPGGILHGVFGIRAITMAVVPEKIGVGFGPCRVAAKSVPRAVELTLILPLAWKALAEDAVAHVTDVEWGIAETPPPAEPPPFGLSERQVREIACEFTAMLVRSGGGEADMRLVHVLRHFGCPSGQLAAWVEHIKAMPLGSLMREHDDAIR